MEKSRTRYILLLTFVVMVISIPAFAQTYTVSGVVRDNNFAPVENVAVQMYDTTGIVIGIYKDTTDIAGFYSIGGVDLDYYDISFRPRTSTGFVPQYMHSVFINSNTTINVTLVPGYFFTGFVFDNQGNGIEDVDLNVYDQTTGLKLFTPGDNTDVDGFYEIVLPSGVFTVAYRYRGTIPNPRYVPVELLNVAVNADTSIDVTLLNGLFVSGEVRGPGNVPVVGADMDAQDVVTGLKIFTPGDNTDNNGHYQMLVPAGTYNINAAPLPADRILPGIVYNFTVSNDVTLNFNLLAGHLISGVVRNPSSVGVYNVNIDVTDTGTGLDVFVPWDKTALNGAYQFVLPNGTFDFEFKPPVVLPYVAGYRQDGFVVNGDELLNATVPWGYLLSGTVFKTSGAAVVDVDLDAVDVSTNIPVPLSGDNTDSSGAYATVVAPGTYHLEYEPPGATRLAAERLTNQPFNSDRQISVVVDTGMAVSGTITEQDGTPIANMRVSAVESVSQQEAFTPGNKSDQTGHYEILLKPETYDLIYSPDPLSGLTDTITIADVVVAHDMVINLVYGIAPVANFSADPLGGNAPLEVAFTDLSLNNPTSWSWTFGDGDVSSLRNPAHVYLNPGTYTVTLTVANGFGSDIETKPGYISVGEGMPPVTDFMASPLIGYPQQQVTFTDLSQNVPSSWSWDFGDGGTSNLENPVHSFQNPGYYTITLTATNQYGSDTEVKQDYISILEGGSCGNYVVGDYNGSGSFNVADVVSAFSKLKTGSPDPYLLCECPPGSGNIWAVAMDVNNSCSMNVADVVAAFSRLKTGAPDLFPCSLCPPAPSPRIGDQPLIVPPNKGKTIIIRSSD